MSLTKETKLAGITIDKYKRVYVQEIVTVKEDEKKISSTILRHTINPGADHANEHADVIAICELIHTPEEIKKYKSLMERTAPV